MIIISYLNAAVQRFIANDEFLPEKVSAFTPYVDVISQRYGFQGHGEMPTNPANLGSSSPVFHSGFFVLQGKVVPILSLDFSPTRIGAVCSTSEQAIGLIDDVISFLCSEHGFRMPNRKIMEFVTSSLVVDFGADYFSKIEALAKLSSLINRYVAKDYDSCNLQIQSVRLNGSASRDSVTLNAQYALEERAGRPPGTSWAFSQAPLSTADHVSMLQELETLFAPGSAKY